MKSIFVILTLGAIAGSIAPASSADFGLAFEWGNIKKCTSGYPNTVPNPAFSLQNVPKGTASIQFRMVDRNVPSYQHGGGTVKYTKGSKIAPGAFKYKSPCPPSGRHTYEWTATAKDSAGKTLGEAKARKAYP